MAIESTFIPYPSEIIMPPAAYLAARGEMNILLIIIAGTLGSAFGATINYLLAYTLGRSIVYYLVNHRYARFLLLNESKLKKAEDYFLKNGRSATFIGRLIPGIRHLISIPAGFCRMNYLSFLGYTLGGAGIWVSILAILGYFFGANDQLLKSYFHEISYALLGLGALFVIYLIYKNYRSSRSGPTKTD
jgi:membrane protein DedA with SNARE-associated domain